jgi:carbamoyl-phosphate synthase small subunit
MNEIAPSNKKRRALLALEDGMVFSGWSFGSDQEAVGEIVFNTSMTGYQEILTDPSYKGQIITMTYPLIGNYGINDEDVESLRPQVEGFIVKEQCTYPSNWRNQTSLEEYLTHHRIPGISGVDTRALTKHIRTAGAMRAVLSSTMLDPEVLVQRAKAWPGLVGKDMVEQVTCSAPFTWSSEDTLSPSWGRRMPTGIVLEERPYKVVAMDFGVKFNILRILKTVGCDITVVPAKTPAQTIVSLKPDGVFLSNGPGDPAAVTYAIKTVQALLGKVPIFGICLGHQLLGLALGGTTFKMKFGHRGANHPVKELATGRVQITTQNHGFCVDIQTLDQEEIQITHINLHDQTLEGFSHKKYPAFSVQHHPEASSGPHDSIGICERFILCMRAAREL